MIVSWCSSGNEFELLVNGMVEAKWHGPPQEFVYGMGIAEGGRLPRDRRMVLARHDEEVAREVVLEDR